ncbi:MAG: peptidoglycan-binding domain-containing protein [Mastigocoleus sp. MO_167.B18]|nr:peptidoglycan-binding domain-containing protein [Mastigocoleus sp. MO_167.B18]
MFPTLQINNQGEAVRFLQQLLIYSKNLNNSDFDAIFGPKTQQAVRNFQNNNGLTVDGVVGQRTWDGLILFISNTCCVNPD